MRKAARDAAFSDFVVARRGPLRRFAYTLTGDWTSAEDVLQSAFTKLYVAWPRLRDEHARDAYARRIILNTHIDETRRARYRRESPGLEGIDAAAPDHDGSTRPAILTALDTLPPMQRKVIVLRHLLDFSVEQTAHELAIAPGTVKSHTHHALAALRTALGDDLTESTRN